MERFIQLLRERLGRVETDGLAARGLPPSGGHGFGGLGGPGGPGGGVGGFGQGGLTVDPALIGYLEANRGSARWLVAAPSANEAASIQLATGEPVMAMGGFSGRDPALTVGRLQRLVADGSLRYVLIGQRGGFERAGSKVLTWVAANGTPVLQGPWGTLYDLAG